ncbi:MAG TPA: ABC transporter permease [Anaerolineales bacterium]|nr:ABC transporter permease [Anaerolineales bacterium]
MDKKANNPILEFFLATRVIMTKDLQVWLRQPVMLVATIAPALVLLLVEMLAAQAVGRSPVALVIQDGGLQGARMAQAIQDADVFRIQQVDANKAQALLKNLDVVAVVTIPADFSQRLRAHQPAVVDVTVNNLNLDFTNDIRRAVPDAITRYYAAQGDQSPILIHMEEHDLRQHDIQMFQYAVLPVVLLVLTISGLISGGNATAREWESATVKELLLAPVPGGAIVAGKVLAGFLTSFALGGLVLMAAYGLGWIYPQGIYWLDALLVVGLTSLLGASLGVAIGAALQHIMPVIAVSVNLAFYLFFLAGGMGVLAFEPVWLQNIAAFLPLTYGNHALQMALFYNSADLLGRDVLVLGISSLVALVLGTLAVRRGMAK